MGDQSGIDLIHIWKQNSQDGRTVFVFITGDRDLSQAVEAMKRGAFDYLSKPINPDKLEEVVRRAVTQAVA